MSATDERVIVNPSGLAAPTGAPAAPAYSWVVKRGPMVFLSGMVAYDERKTLIGDDLETQARQAFRNLRTAIEAAGGDLNDICSITVYVPFTDLQQDVYPAVNKAGSEAFGTRPPARSVVGGVAMPRPTELVMISAVALLGSISG